MNTSHPLGLGMPDTANPFFEDGPILRPRGEAGTVGVATRYAASDVFASGLLIGADAIAGTAAAVDVQAGDGRAVLFGFRPQQRAQSHGTYKLLFNALYMAAQREGDG